MGRFSNAKERLVTEALRLMQQRSYGAVGVAAICKEAGVNKGSFYYFFPGKSELAIAALERCWQDFERNVIDPSFDPDIPPIDRLRHFWDSLIEYIREAQDETGHVCGCVFGSLGSELSSLDEGVRTKAAEIFLCYHRRFEQLLEEAKAEGLVDAQDTSETAKALVTYIEGAVLQAKIANNIEQLRKLEPYVLRLIGALPSNKQRQPRQGRLHRGAAKGKGRLPGKAIIPDQEGAAEAPTPGVPLLDFID